MLDERLDHPAEGARHRQDHARDGKALDGLTPHIERALLRVGTVIALEVVVAEVEHRIVRDFGMLRQERDQRWIRLQIGLVGEQRRIQPQHAHERRRILVEEPFQLVFRLLCGQRRTSEQSLRLARGQAAAGRPMRLPRSTGR